MSRASVLLGALTNEPTSTSELYERVGYPTLARVGLVRYADFRAELARLSATGLAERHTGLQGATMWRLATPPGEHAGPGPPPPPGGA